MCALVYKVQSTVHSIIVGTWNLFEYTSSNTINRNYNNIALVLAIRHKRA